MKLSRLFIRYLKLIERTSRIEITGTECLKSNFLVGFWHQDSFMMTLVLDIMSRRGQTATVIITGDPRGDYIEEMVEAFHGTPYRLAYSEMAAHSAVKGLIKELSESGVNIATPLDGPLGPLHEPKKFLLLLAQKTGKSFIGARVEYSRKLRLFTRWDKYVVPLPFGRISISLYDFGAVAPDDLKNFSAYSTRIKERLNAEDSYRNLEPVCG